MSNTKRTSNQIQAEIARLQGELEDIREEELKMSTAVRILENLGWTRRAGKWERPVSSPKTSVDYKESTILTKGVLVAFDNSLYISSSGINPSGAIALREVLEVKHDCTLVTMPHSISVNCTSVYRTSVIEWAGYKKFK